MRGYREKRTYERMVKAYGITVRGLIVLVCVIAIYGERRVI